MFIYYVLEFFCDYLNYVDATPRLQRRTTLLRLSSVSFSLSLSHSLVSHTHSFLPLTRTTTID